MTEQLRIWAGITGFMSAAALLALVLLIALVVGGVVIGVSFLVPEGPFRVALWVIGGIPGGLAWVGYPVVWLSIASTAR